MATLTKVYGNLEAQGFTKVEIDAVEDNSVKRDYLLPNNIYGGNNATVKGTWKADKVGIIVNKNNEIKRKIVWAVCFVPEGAKESVCDLTKSFLLSTGRYDADNNHIAPKGDIRQWADTHIINGKLDKEWCGELSTLLNTRGLCVVNTEYRANRKDGGSFTATLQQPYFADTFGK
jgi:hypothetical protein